MKMRIPGPAAALLATMLATMGVARGASPEAVEHMASTPAVSALTVAAGTPASGFGEPQSGPWIECGEIAYRLSALNPRLVAGEPLRLRLELRRKNEAGPVPDVFYSRMLFGHDLRGRVTPPGGVPFDYEPIAIPLTITNTTTIELAQYRRMRFDFEMVMDRDSVTGALFDTPGTYRVEIGMRCRTSEGDMSGPIGLIGSFAVEVAPAEGADRVALDILSRRPEVFRAVLLPVTMKPEDMTLLERAIREAPGARVAPYLKMAVASARTADRSKLALVAGEYAEIVKSHPGHPVAEDARLARIGMLRALGQTAEANAEFAQMWAESSGAGKLLTAVDLLSEMKLGRSMAAGEGLGDLTAESDWVFRE